ncbi:MAG TPA: hypothetical protein VFB77_20185, partial [Acidimicrobiales bacterium]|nr:hypothetical protein [Acidimicrobiales bacterium]
MADPSVAPAIAAPLGDVETDRLSLRRVTPGDLDELAALSVQAEVWRFPYGRGRVAVRAVGVGAGPRDRGGDGGAGRGVHHAGAGRRVLA